MPEHSEVKSLVDKFNSGAPIPPVSAADIKSETMLPLFLALSPAEVAAKAKEEMLAGGYDPEKPNVDGKFLNWLRNRC